METNSKKRMNKTTKAVSLSAFLFPGLGQLYLKQYIKGSFFTIIAAVGVIMLLPSLFKIMPEIFNIANSIANNIVLGKTVDIQATLNSIKKEAAVFQTPNLVLAKIAMIASWFISSIDAWLSGRNLENKKEKIH